MKDNIEDLIEETQERHEEKQESIEQFHEAVKEESDTDILETKCNIVGDIIVDVSAKKNGELIDKMGQIEERLEYVDENEVGTYKITQAAEDAATLLDDVVDDPELTKQEFYKVYRSEGLEELGKILESVFESIQNEGERQQGAADGFRQK